MPSGPHFWTDEEDQLLLRLTGDGGREWKQWAAEHFPNRSGGSLRKRWDDYLKERDEYDTVDGGEDDAVDDDGGDTPGIWHLEPEFLDKKDVPPPDWKRIIAHAEQGKALSDEAEARQRIGTVRLQGPCAIVYSADWHLGSVAVDYASWVQHISTVLDVDNLYMINLADERENMRSFRNLAGVLDQVLTPRQQARALEGIVMELTEKGKIIAMLGGTHDEEFDERLFGESLNSYIYRECKAPLFSNRGLLRVIVEQDGAEVEFSHLLFHKSRYSSFIHALHGTKREYQQSFPARVVAGAHDHTPGIEYYWRYSLAEQAGYAFGGMSLLIKAGTFNASNYGWKYWGNSDPPIMPCIVFDGRDMIAYPHIEQAAKALQYLRK